MWGAAHLIGRAERWRCGRRATDRCPAVGLARHCRATSGLVWNSRHFMIDQFSIYQSFFCR